jgi:8-hydroxy-5-deazaflavin:NADPH oxidoreductase
MRLTIIGAGNVGATLARAFAGKGHEIILAARDTGSPRVQAALGTLGDQARALSVAEAVAAADAVVLATPWEGTQAALSSAGDLGGKVLVDCTNPLGPGFSLTLGHTTSGAEQVAAWAPGARVVKAFNTTGYDNMADPRYPEAPATMFICGDDAEAKQVVSRLAEDISFEAVDCGPLTQARLLEPLAVLWITLAVSGMGRDFAFRLMRR